MTRVMMVVVAMMTLVNGARGAETARELAAHGGELIERAIEIRGDDAERSDELLGEGVALLRGAERESAGRSAELQRTLGGASLMLGDTGRAVLHLRRAERLDPTDRRVRETLSEARRQVRSGVAPGAGSRVREAALWWRGHVPRTVVLFGTLAAWVGAWGIAIVRRALRWERGGLSFGVLLGVSLIGGGALASEQALDRASREGVLIEDGVMAYNGPSADVYPPTFTEPVRAGVELRVLERREGWARVELGNGQETWVPERAVEMVTPGDG